MAPTSFLGRMVSVVVAYMGVACLAMPITIIAKHFGKQVRRR